MTHDVRTAPRATSRTAPRTTPRPASRTTSRPAEERPGRRPDDISDAALEDHLTMLFKALSDPIRLGIVRILLRRESREACVGELLISFHQTGSTVSHHLKILLGAGLVTRRRQGTRLFYRLRAEELRNVDLLLTQLGDVSQPRQHHTLPGRPLTTRG
ncbi:ArsR/SmtB family transcription factor [Kitasatospora sp. NPDC050543]|uniref:ArsR/SmtB family transcription factor n=1 Tax=Kitasatospora sp. NPDC050543 TaxID=3364054 RepID=UPI0037A8D612